MARATSVQEAAAAAHPSEALAVFDARWRQTVERGTAPMGAVLRRAGVTADQLTALGLVIAVAAAVVIGTGNLVAGGLLVGASGLPDLLDGPVAKASGSASTRGAFFDSVSDRVTDSLLLGGVAWYLATGSGGHVAVLPLAVLGASMLVSYQRAKAESLGLSATGGLMERAERLIALGIGLLVQPFLSLLVPVLWLMLVLTGVTAVQRFVKVWRQAPTAAPVAVPERRWRAGRVESRWRAWREAAEGRSGAPAAISPGTDGIQSEADAGRSSGGVWGTGGRRTGAPSGRWRARRSGDTVERWRARRRAAGLGSGRARSYATGLRRGGSDHRA